MKNTFIFFVLLLICSQSYGQKPRARDLGVPFVGTTGDFNAITDVKGVEVGYSTIISGKGENIAGKGLSLIHISEPTRLGMLSRMPSSA